MSKQPPPAPTASTIGPCPTEIQIVGRPGTGSLPSTFAPPDHPLSGLEPSPETAAPWYLNALLPFSLSLSLSLDAIGAVCHQFGLLGTNLHLIPCEGFVESFY